MATRHNRYGTPYAAMAVGVPSRDTDRQLAVTLADEQYGIHACEIGRDIPERVDAVRIGTLHGFKGLEFQRVFLAGVSERLIPHQRLETYRHEQVERYRQEEQRSRSLLFVAATRARDELVITWNGKAGRYLPEHATRSAGHATEILVDDGPPSGSAAA
ncbi:3'-5' exonuclease [Streptomyces sp. NPDC012510]|uniref:3'-5' exonuclease n=1 Tax=Streptomyces sp. NPDC012510 TaxID=3364838 RepID=UPI0036EDDBC2